MQDIIMEVFCDCVTAHCLKASFLMLMPPITRRLGLMRLILFGIAIGTGPNVANAELYRMVLMLIGGLE